MEIDGFEELMLRRDSGDLCDVAYLEESRKIICNLPVRTEEEVSEQKALLEYVDSLRARAMYWENQEIETLAGQVEGWLFEPTLQ